MDVPSRRWSLLLVGKTNGIVAQVDHDWSKHPDHYEKVVVVEEEHANREIERLRAELSAVKSELRDVTIAVDDERVNNTMTLAQCVAEAVAQNEALLEKLDALAPTGTCACSYDASGDVCMRHSPEVMRLRAELAECSRDAEKYRTALEQILAPFEDLNFVSGNKLLTYIHDVATAALAADGVAEDV